MIHRKYKENWFKICKSGYLDAINLQGDKLSEFNTDSLSKLGTFYNSPIRVDFNLLNWGASSRWLFCPNSAWSSIETTTIGKTHSTLIIAYNSKSLTLDQLVKQIKVSKDVLFGLESQIGKCAESIKSSVSTIQKIIIGLNNLKSFSSITGLSVFNEIKSEFEDFQMNQSEMRLIMNAMTRQISISMERLIIDNSTRKG